MRRLVLIPLGLLGLATLGLASGGAFASRMQANAALTGRIASLSSTAITVGRLRGRRLTCKLTPYSPGVGPFAIGDRVKIACSHRVLVAIADVPPRVGNAANEDAVTTGISGTVTDLDGQSISVHDGPNTVTCSLGPGSPSTTGYSLGSHVKIGCENGILVSIGTPPPPPIAHGDSTTTTTTTSTAPTGTYTAISGTIGTLNDSTITVVGGGDSGTASLTCTIGSGSPSTSGFSSGNPVRMYCLNGVLYQLRHNDTPPPTTSTTTTTTTTSTTTLQNVTGISGTLGALNGTSITVTGGGDSGTASLTCTIGSGSPDTSGFNQGDSVRMYCVSGVLYQLKHNDSPPPAPVPPTTSTTTTTTSPSTSTTTTSGTYTNANGNLSALGASSITVGDLTCTISQSSPSTAGFSVGNSVRMYCLNGALYSLAHN